MNPFERSQWMNLFFLSRSSCHVGMVGGNPAYTTISIKSRPVFGPARKSRSFSQSRPRPAVRTELPTFDSSTSTNTRERGRLSASLFRTDISFMFEGRKGIVDLDMVVLPDVIIWHWTLGVERWTFAYSFGDEASIYTRRGRPLWTGGARSEEKRGMVSTRPRITKRIRVRKWRRRRQQECHDRVVQRQAVAADARPHVVSFAKHVDLTQSARASEETQGGCGRSWPRDWAGRAWLKKHGPLVPRSGQVSLGAFGSK